VVGEENASISTLEATPDAAWDAWASTGSQRKAAALLMVSKTQIGKLIALYRAQNHLPMDAKPELQRDRERREAYEAFKATGSLADAARSLGLPMNTVRGRVNSWMAEHGLSDQTDTRQVITEADAKAAWLAWEVCGTMEAAAASMGMTLPVFRLRVRRHRTFAGLSTTAKPQGWRATSPRESAPAKPKPKRIDRPERRATWIQKLDALLSLVEAAPNARQREALRHEMRRIEARLYGEGLEPPKALERRMVREDRRRLDYYAGED